MDRILVVGATGFIGGHLTNRLLSAGVPTRVLTRNPARIPQGWIGRVEVALGSLLDRASLLAATAGISSVCNLAGELRDPAYFYPVNVEGVRTLLEIAENSGVTQFVQMSSVGVIGARESGLVDENTRCRPKNDYEDSKYRAEEIVRQFAADGHIQARILRPAIVFGEGARTGKDSLLEWLRFIRKLRCGLVAQGAVANYIYVGDVVEACLQMLASPYRSPQIYIVNDPTSMRDFVLAAASALHIVPRCYQISPQMAQVTSQMLEVVQHKVHISLPLTMARLRALTTQTEFSAAKLQRELDFKPPIGFREGLARTIHWYERVGLLPGGIPKKTE